VALGVVVATAGIVGSPRRASAHASALDALTLDLLLDQSGLVVVDAATNHASYDEAPPPPERAAIATQVLEAIGVPADSVQVDPDRSSLYHQVGFTLAFHAAFANGAEPGQVRIDSAPLQTIAATFGTLTLDVCRIARSGLVLTVDATAPPTAPDPGGAGAPQTDRADCRTWRLGPNDPPIVVTARAEATGRSVPVARERVKMPCGAPSEGDPTFIDEGAIARSPRTLLAHATGPASARLLEGDTGVEFSTRTRVDLVVPPSERGHLSFGEREGPRATRRLRVPECTYDQHRPWTISALRIWVDAARCVPVTVRTPASEVTVRFPVGVPCEGEAS
jgi:hypothetical protein